MIKELLEKLYAKLEDEPDNNRKSKTGCFIFFEEKILTQQKFDKFRNISVSSKTMKNYYEKHVEGRKNKSKEPSAELKNCISEYLGYNNYLHFCNNFKEKSKNSSQNNFVSLKKKTSYCCSTFFCTNNLFNSFYSK